jgi:hypothetical protein
MANNERGSDAVTRGKDAVARAIHALRDVVAAIDAGEVPNSGVLRNHLVGVVVTLDMLTGEHSHEHAR